MAIVINQLRKAQIVPQSDIVYVDINLDLDAANINNDFGRSQKKPRNLKLDYNEQAIRNSLMSIINTTPGELHLTPDFGILPKIKAFLFNPLNEDQARLLGETIHDAFIFYEPRIRVLKMSCVPDYEQEAYDVKMVLRFPKFSREIEINGKLTPLGFRET